MTAPPREPMARERSGSAWTRSRSLRQGRLRAALRTDERLGARPRARGLSPREAPGEPGEERARHTATRLPRPEGPHTDGVAPEGALDTVRLTVADERRSPAPRLLRRPARPGDAAYAEVRVGAGDEHPGRLVLTALAVVDEQHSILAGGCLRLGRRRTGLGKERRGRNHSGDRSSTRSRHGQGAS